MHKAGLDNFLMCGPNKRSESIMSTRFMTQGLMLADKGTRVFSMIELYSCRKCCAIQLLMSLRQLKTAVRLFGSPGVSGKYICVASA